MAISTSRKNPTCVYIYLVHAPVSYDVLKCSQTLVNLVIFSNLDIVMPQLPELDYLAYCTFEIYERLNNAGEKQFSVRISLCEGAHAFPLDVHLDAKHALQVQPRRFVSILLPSERILLTHPTKLFQSVDQLHRIA